jgi:hypothetical protein
MTRKLLLAAAAALAFLALAAPVLAGGVPETARDLAAELDAQIVDRLQLAEGPAKGQVLMITTPASLDDLEQSSPLARLFAEELAAWFVQAGYRVQDIRKGKTVLFAPKTGELLLTRDVQLLAESQVASALILVGTFTETTRNVRFNIKLMHAPDNEVMAMSSRTIPMSPELAELATPPNRERLTRNKPVVSTKF